MGGELLTSIISTMALDSFSFRFNIWGTKMTTQKQIKQIPELIERIEKLEKELVELNKKLERPLSWVNAALETYDKQRLPRDPRDPKKDLK